MPTTSGLLSRYPAEFVVPGPAGGARDAGPGLDRVRAAGIERHQDVRRPAELLIPPLWHSKVQIIAHATTLLDAEEARQAEALVLGQARLLSPGALRHAITLAVAQVAPEKAKKRREHAARDARVERWPEDSGNAALAGRQLPPAEALAADQRITWWARQLQAAGLEGDMDQLRARAYLDILLDQDSRPSPPAAPPRTAPPRIALAPITRPGRIARPVPAATFPPDSSAGITSPSR